MRDWCHLYWARPPNGLLRRQIVIYVYFVALFILFRVQKIDIYYIAYFIYIYSWCRAAHSFMTTSSSTNEAVNGATTLYFQHLASIRDTFSACRLYTRHFIITPGQIYLIRALSISAEFKIRMIAPGTAGLSMLRCYAISILYLVYAYYTQHVICLKNASFHALLLFYFHSAFIDFTASRSMREERHLSQRTMLAATIERHATRALFRRT